MQLVVQPGGIIRCVYAETLNLKVLGRLHIDRGSHVEPDDAGNWHADLSPAGGPLLGPFARRQQALAAELQWLESNWLPPS